MTKVIQKLWSILISMKTMVVLTLIFAVSIAVATFIENDYGTDTSWALVYAAKWFEVLQVLLGLNLLGNIIRFKLYKPKKLPAFIFHVGFLIILLGSGLTRYMGYEGVMHIREGMSENRMLSADAFLQITAKNGNESVYKEKKLFISAIGGNDFDESVEIGGKILHVRYKDFIKNAEKVAIPDENGNPLVVFTVATPSGPEKYFLSFNEYTDLGPFVLAFGKKEPTDIQKPYLFIYLKDGKFYFKSNKDIGYFKMAEQEKGLFEAGKEYPFTTKMMYLINGIQVVPQEALLKGIKKVVRAEENSNGMKMKGTKLSALIVEAELDGEKKEVALMGLGRRFKGFTENVNIGDTQISLEWGSKEIELPFYLYLKDFVIEKYPGSMSPSSYESHVILYDEKNGVKMPYRIYMNNTLEYGGFKFFQSSYDQDEKGTILSVNHDPGKWPTYLGYFLLGLGFLLNLLNPYSRFGKLARTRYIQSAKKPAAAAIAFLMLLFTNNLNAANEHAGHNHSQIDMKHIIETVKKIDKKHAENYGSILLQSHDGRIKPIDSAAIDILNKIHGSDTMLGLTHNQIILGMAAKPTYWQRIKMIKVNHPGVKKLLGIPEDEKYFAFVEIFDKNGNYKLAEAVEKATRKRPGERDKFDKEVIKVDERLNIAYMVYSGEFMKVFPLKGDPNKTWYSPAAALKTFPPQEAKIIRAILEKNFKGLNKGLSSGDWSLADEAVNEIKAYQQKYGADIIPSKSRIEAELLYNRLDIFNRLVPVYLLSGLVLLFLIFARLMKPSLNLEVPTKIVVGILIIAFLAHTFNLGLRWYIAGHAPWSNGYEAMLYISWAIILSGILFARQSEFAVSSTAIFAGITLFVAHLSWLDPQITTMVPVLKSYWLTIHVSVITASYGFLGLSALLGFIALILFIMLGFTKKDETRKQIILNIKEAGRINEMSMIVGLSLLTVGNFLGGVWANESWGRYWGWDPKETWALVTILVYTAVVHLRFIPKVWNSFNFAALSVVAYSSVIMTYFGVNYYLSGLHSYAAGDPVPVPTWVYYAIVIVAAIIAAAYRNRKVFEQLQKSAIKIS
ncbi:cytochrome c biogenesis protein CcsA [Nitrosophilus alvini]|uniref:cytochrome c biogenesis protein CcsA n=1 Tax=Nitrosophilus alvini TaxID=2714855 RepID=UPI00190DEE9F|nr:cytochrome c biogenesis protein CcsA [Nitrosophilus alvini]